MERYREGVWVEASFPSVKWLWKEKATDAVLRFLKGTRVGYISTRGKPPVKEYGRDGTDGGEGEEYEPGPP